jgi:TonB family protein
MGSGFRAAAALVAFFAALPLCAQAPQQTPAEQYKQLVDSTQLDAKGAQPFHLKIDAQVYALYGRSSSPATIEEWWLAPDQFRIEMNSGSFHEVVASGEPDTQNPAIVKPDVKEADIRTSYLLDLLFKEIVHPLGPPNSFLSIKPTTEKFGKAALSCLQVKLDAAAFLAATAGENGPPGSEADGTQATACVAAGTNILRVELRDPETVVRNDPQIFNGKNVGFATVIAYSGRTAIIGKITALEVFDPTAPGAPVLQRIPQTPQTAGSTVLSGKGGMTPGRLLKMVPAGYPQSARASHISGTVVLHAIIDREGKISSAVILASPDASFSDAALVAVRQWRYEPCRLNGQPTETDTTIQMSFHLN